MLSCNSGGVFSNLSYFFFSVASESSADGLGQDNVAREDSNVFLSYSGTLTVNSLQRPPRIYNQTTTYVGPRTPF